MIRQNVKFPHLNASMTNETKQGPEIFGYFPKMEANGKEFIFNKFDNFEWKCSKMR